MENFEDLEDDQQITMGVPCKFELPENQTPIQKCSLEFGIQSIEQRKGYSMPDLGECRRKARISMYNYKNLKSVHEKLGTFFTDLEFFEEGVYTVIGKDEQRGNYIYIGTLDPGLIERDGVGLCIFQSGHMYEGFWETNKAEGEGRYIYKNQNYYQGMFENDKMHGKGTMHFADGTVQQGNWENDQFIYQKSKFEEYEEEKILPKNEEEKV